jgi:asparagine synthase (glutamine-hydrolysing)
MLAAVLRYTSRLYFSSAIDLDAVPPWIQVARWKRHIQYQRVAQKRTPTYLERPVTLANEAMWWCLMETLPHLFPAFHTRREFRYPFLDKQLVEFLFSIPREQLLQPGRRRHLMRNALRGIVPDPILERRRKAYLVRSPLTALRNGQADIASLFEQPRIGQLEYVSIPILKESMQRVINGRDLRWLHALTRMIAFELWMREREIFKASSSVPDRREQPISA